MAAACTARTAAMWQAQRWVTVAVTARSGPVCRPTQRGLGGRAAGGRGGGGPWHEFWAWTSGAGSEMPRPRLSGAWWKEAALRCTVFAVSMSCYVNRCHAERERDRERERRARERASERASERAREEDRGLNVRRLPHLLPHS